MIDPGAYDIESTLETITLLCEQSGEPCDGARFRELILKARAFLAARRTVSGQEAALTVHVINGEVIDAQNIGNLMDGEYRLYAAPIPATELLNDIRGYLQCVVDSSMSRNNALALASELMEQIDQRTQSESS